MVSKYEVEMFLEQMDRDIESMRLAAKWFGPFTPKVSIVRRLWRVLCAGLRKCNPWRKPQPEPMPEPSPEPIRITGGSKIERRIKLYGEA